MTLKGLCSDLWKGQGCAKKSAKFFFEKMIFRLCFEYVYGRESPGSAEKTRIESARFASRYGSIIPPFDSGIAGSVFLEIS
jgi:hypothetical protein